MFVPIESGPLVRTMTCPSRELAKVTVSPDFAWLIAYRTELASDELSVVSDTVQVVASALDANRPK